MRTQKGITLVALVITIIVLLILAGVSISMALGENGILTRAENAVDKNTIAEEREKISMAVFALEMAKHTDGEAAYDTDAEINAFLTTELGAESGYTVTGTGDAYSITGPSGIVYTVDLESGTVSDPNGETSSAGGSEESGSGEEGTETGE